MQQSYHKVVSVGSGKMDWIERWFGLSPDNGDGSLELLLVLICVFAVSFIAVALNPRWRRLAGGYLAGLTNGAATPERRIK